MSAYLKKLRKAYGLPEKVEGEESPYLEELRRIWLEQSYAPEMPADDQKAIVKAMSKGMTKKERSELVREIVATLRPGALSVHRPMLYELLKMVRPLLPKAPEPKMPSREELEAIMKPLIPAPLRGDDGKTPKNEDLIAMIEPLVQQALLDMPRDAVTPNYDEIVGAIMPILDEKIRLYRRGWFGGGGDLVGAGTGILITRNAIGRKIISVETPGGGVGAWSTPIEAPAADGSVLVFTVGATEPTDVVRDGITVYKDIHWTFAAGQITFVDGNGPTQYVRYR